MGNATFDVGDSCVEVIDRCGCTAPCYRASSLEYVHDYSAAAVPVDSQEQPDDVQQLDQPSVKVFDVGQCMGVCDAPSRKQHCVLRDTVDTSKCLMALTRPANNCVPLGFQLHRYRTKNGSDKSVLTITECGCLGGKECCHSIEVGR